MSRLFLSLIICLVTLFVIPSLANKDVQREISELFSDEKTLENAFSSFLRSKDFSLMDSAVTDISLLAETNSTTDAPTEAPTLAPVLPVADSVTITAEQSFNGISAADYQANLEENNEIFAKTVAAVVDGITADDVTVTGVTDATSRRLLEVNMDNLNKLTVNKALSQIAAQVNQESISTESVGCIVAYRIFIASTIGTPFASGADAVSAITQQLVIATGENGTFAATLVAFASESNSSSIFASGNFTVAEVQVTGSSVKSLSSSDDDNKLTDGEIAGIVIGVVIGTALIVAVIVWFMFYRTPTSNPTQTGESYVMPQEGSQKKQGDEQMAMTSQEDHRV